MKTILRLIFLILLLGGWGLAAAALHVVRTPTTITVVPKDRLSFADTYVDTRSWTLADAANHPAVVARLLALGKANVLSNLADPKSSEPLEVQLHSATQPSGKQGDMTLGKVISQLDIAWR